jgi:hypothetical protein
VSAIAGLFQALLEAAKGLPGLRRDQKRKAVLRSMLEDPAYNWRSLATLARSIGVSDDKTRELLVSIGARASTTGQGEVWGLTSRVGSSGTRSSREA